jgi:hypothetical protein
MKSLTPRRAPRSLPADPRGRVAHRLRATTVMALAGAVALTIAGTQIAGAGVADAATHGSGTGFSIPFSGPARYEYLAPTELTNPGQLNQPLGQRAADRIARALGLRKTDTFTQKQYLEFISGGGVGGNRTDAKVVDDSVLILTNTTGRPLYSNVDGVITPSVLASYGLFVNTKGLLESPANADAPTRQVNTIIAPGGYLGKWMRANGATRSLVMLYSSPFTVEAAYGFAAQQRSGAAQLVTNTKGGVSTTVGMSMAPALWLVNFILIYILNPTLAAFMPAHWAPIPANVAHAIRLSPTGQVSYSKYESSFPRRTHV